MDPLKGFHGQCDSHGGKGQAWLEGALECDVPTYPQELGKLSLRLRLTPDGSCICVVWDTWSHLPSHSRVLL